MIEFLQGYEDYFGDWVWEMGEASLGTLQLMFVSFWLACAIGMVVALVHMARFRVLSALAKLYIGFFRGVPVLVILYWIYFALPEMGYEVLVISSYTAAVLGLGIHGGAFLAEIFRSGIESLHKGQMEAALSVGMTPAKAMAYIILPQAVRVVLPPIANYAVGLLKETALCSIIAAPELMLRAKDLASSSFLPMHAFVMSAVFYYMMSFPMMRAVEYLEVKMGAGQRAG
jgi:His/Glu/Gln/Arg/opine family amino acid ABC transporter permease subunit